MQSLKDFEIIVEKGGCGLLSQYQGSPSKMLSNIFPNHNWIPSKFEYYPQNYWESKDNQREFLNWLGNHLQFTNYENWYDISYEKIKENGGINLLRYYDNSPAKMVMNIYNEHLWLPWKFTVTPKGMWLNKDIQKQYMNWLGEKLDFNKNKENWYKISYKNMLNNYGRTLLSLYKNSPSTVVMEVYDDYPWLPWKFQSTVKNFWSKKENQKFFLDWLGNHLGYHKLEDWSNVTNKEIVANGGERLLELYNGSVVQLLESNFPEFSWLPWKFGSTPNGFWKNRENQRNFMKILAKN